MAFGAFKKRYVYTDDGGNNWVVKIAEDRVLNVSPATGLTAFNPASLPTNFRGRINPKRCRQVFATTTIAVGTEASHIIRRSFICQITSTLYTATASQNVSYTGEDEADAITLTTTGKRGERVSF